MTVDDRDLDAVNLGPGDPLLAHTADDLRDEHREPLRADFEASLYGVSIWSSLEAHALRWASQPRKRAKKKALARSLSPGRRER